MTDVAESETFEFYTVLKNESAKMSIRTTPTKTSFKPEHLPKYKSSSEHVLIVTSAFIITTRTKVRRTCDNYNLRSQQFRNSVPLYKVKVKEFKLFLQFFLANTTET